MDEEINGQFLKINKKKIGYGYDQVKRAGVSVFLMQAGVWKSIEALYNLVALFVNSEWGEESNIKFLEKEMGTTFKQRPHPWPTKLNVDDIHSGDFLALSKIRGLSGAFETLEKWVTGSYAGHSALCLRDSKRNLWVAESGRGNDGMVCVSFYIIIIPNLASSTMERTYILFF